MQQAVVLTVSTLSRLGLCMQAMLLTAHHFREIAAEFNSDLHANPMFGQQWDRAMTTTRFKSPEHQPGFIQICMLDAEFTQEVCSPEL